MSDTDRTVGDVRGRAAGPIRSLVLGVSGANREFLRLVPTEEDVFLVLGGSVLLSAFLAAAGGTVAASMWSHGSLSLSWPYVLAGLLTGLLVGSVDRLLIRSPMNPYRFPPEVTAALRAPRSKLDFDSALAALYLPTAASRARQLGNVLPSFFLRLALSVSLSYIFATLLLFVVFSPEIQQRATYINGQIQSQLINSTNTKYDSLEKPLTTRLAHLEAPNPVLARAQTQVKTAQKRVAAFTADRTVLEAAHVNEVSRSVRQRFTLSSGQTIVTSGVPGEGKTASSIDSMITTNAVSLSQATADLQAAQAALRTATHSPSAVQAGSTQSIHDLQTRIDNLERSRANELQAEGAAESSPNAARPTQPKIQGLLVRQAALQALEADANPVTMKIDPPSNCHALACRFERVILPATPLGSWVLAFRAVFLLVDLLPILLKLQFSLRERRPYDALIAAHEEIEVAAALNIAHEGLVKTRLEIDNRLRAATTTTD